MLPKFGVKAKSKTGAVRSQLVRGYTDLLGGVGGEFSVPTLGWLALPTIHTLFYETRGLFSEG